ncbi:MAG: hypothetical protein ACOYJO_05970 [Eubacterium sp.]|jgi:hypothetical protein
MEQIIHQLLAEYEKNIFEKILGNGLYDLDAMTAELFESCAEGLVGHILSERLSRDPAGWSKVGLGKMAKLRVSVLNGRKIQSADFKGNEPLPKYSEYEERIIRESISGATDWSIFEKERPIMDLNSGTQWLRLHGSAQSLMN